jgi:hopanoid biosynthesis associated protein HpnK
MTQGAIVDTCKLIVHADDFGISEQVNSGILEAHNQGILTSTSIMATGAAFEDAVAMCRTAPALDVGIHLTLVEEQSLVSKELIPSLLDADGRFYGHATAFTKRYFAGKIRIAEVIRELEAQIQKVLDHGLAISHLDSHQHVHMLPDIWRAVVGLAKKYHIPAVRLAREKLRVYMLQETGAVARIPPLLVLNLLAGLRGGAEVMSTDHFVGFFFGGNMVKTNLKTVLQNLPAFGTCELMCHPGHGDADSHYRHWHYNWADELAALVDPEIRNLLSNRGVKLISYRDLG